MITSLDQLDFSKKYSYSDYLKWQFSERLELLKGYIYKMSPAPSRRHQELVHNFSLSLGNYVRGKKCKIYPAPFDVRLPNKSETDTFTVLQPDICVVCDLSKLDDKGCVGAPDLVIEILSPGNTEKEMKIKYSIYEEAGVKEYWIVQPEYNNVHIYLLNEATAKFVAARPLTSSDTLIPSIFPDLQIDLESVFEE